MSDTGFKLTGNVVSVGAWANLTTTRLNSDDGSYATRTGNTYSQGTLNNYAFGIPAGASIDGIEVNVNFRCNNAAYTSFVRLSLSWNNGTNFTATKEDSVLGNTDTTRTYGGAADTWGRTWTDTEFADGTFLLSLEGRTDNVAGICGVDYLEIKVYYTAAGSFVATLIII